MSFAPATAKFSTPTSRRHFILGTAGHIDHGKTSLVRALTGTDPDRLPEERRRGMTIELGFAELAVEGTRFGIVDVPGHERFVRTMVAGATGIDVALLVIAADDSVMPQTIEHIEILELLGVARAVVALTKIDLVDRETAELAAEDASEVLRDTSLSRSEICPVSSATGAGLKELKEALLRAVGDMAITSEGSPFRLAVDRVFSVSGRGTVVTGSVLRGTVAAGDTLEVWPGGLSCRVRDLQAHGVHQDVLARGQRAALNLSGIDRDAIARGSQLTTPGYLSPSPMVDVLVKCVGSASCGMKSAVTMRLGTGTADDAVRVVLHDRPGLSPGESAYGQLRSGTPLCLTYGQRFILRDEASLRTVGGGRVLRPIARRKRRASAEDDAALVLLDHGSKEDRVEQVLRSAGFHRPSDLQICALAGVEPSQLPEIMRSLTAAGKWFAAAGTETYVTAGAVDDLVHRLQQWLERYHRAHSDLPGRPVEAVVGWLERMAGRSIARALFEKFKAKKAIHVLGRFACSPSFTPALNPADERLLSEIVEEVKATGFQPPALEELKAARQVDRKRLQRLATLATATGSLVQIDSTMYLHSELEARLRAVVGGLIDERGQTTVAEVREAISSSRKYIIPLLEYLDRVGFTKRKGDARVRA